MSDSNNQAIAAKLAKLDELVAWFDSDLFDLEQALDKFTEAEALAAEIEQELGEFKNAIEIVKARFDRAGE